MPECSPSSSADTRWPSAWTTGLGALYQCHPAATDRHCASQVDGHAIGVPDQHDCTRHFCRTHSDSTGCHHFDAAHSLAGAASGVTWTVSGKGNVTMSAINDREFLGQGLAFPLQISPRGQVSMAVGATDIEQSIRIILGTMPGERVMRPEFGCRAWELLFEPNHTVSHGMMSIYVQEALAMWEPRIAVQDVQAYRAPEMHNAMLVEVTYTIKTTHDKRSIVFPFYIAEE